MFDNDTHTHGPVVPENHPSQRPGPGHVWREHGYGRGWGYPGVRDVSAHEQRPKISDGEIDLRGFHPGRDGFTIHALKRDAVKAARAVGLPASAVFPAFTRFCGCWVVGEHEDERTFVALGTNAYGPAFVRMRFAAPT